MAVTMHPVESSNIAEIGHDGTHMHVKFKSGSTYRYHDVPAATFEAAKASDSVGKFINQHVKGKHAHTKMEES